MFINEEERQLDKKVKVVRSEQDGKYYSKFDENGQNIGPFVKLLQSRSNCGEYTMPGTP